MRRVTNGGARRILANGLAVASRRESIFQGGIGESRCGFILVIKGYFCIH